MADSDGVPPSHFWRLRFGLALLFLLGVSVGIFVAHMERGGGWGATFVLLVAVPLLAAAGCAWLIVRNLRSWGSEEPLTPKERLNRNILIASGLLGFVLAMLMTIAGGGELTDSNVFSSAPLPPAVAIVAVLVLGLLVPALSIYWHRSAVDEQEADAYKTGALYGLYVYMVGAPVWWFAWRGGFAPEPDGIVIYFATIFTLGTIWLWKKYR